jgi:nitrite reductase (NADH) large subunit
VGRPDDAAELRAIADAAEKYNVPTVKVTGGQRIDLLGVKKEDLPAMWADLNAAGMVSGHAYGKSIRTVKTCVGAEHCRFGTQLAMTMGVKLEKMLFDMYAPHKVKLAVSGCPRNCAEAGIKDVGVIGVDSGYELYIGGNGGIKTEVAQFLCKVNPTRRSWNIPAPSCSSTARRLVPGAHLPLPRTRRPGLRQGQDSRG